MLLVPQTAISGPKSAGTLPVQWTVRGGERKEEQNRARRPNGSGELPNDTFHFVHIFCVLYDLINKINCDMPLNQIFKVI